MNKFLVFLFFLCAGIHIQASDANNQRSDNHAIAVAILEERRHDAAEVIAANRSACDKIGDYCLKASVVSLSLGCLIMFSTLLYKHGRKHFDYYIECGQYSKDASRYEETFFHELDRYGRQECVKVSGCSYVGYNEFEKLPHVRCELPIVPPLFWTCNVMSNVTLDNFGDPFVNVWTYSTSKSDYPAGCMKYIDYAALCKKAKAVRKIDLCKAAKVCQQQSFRRVVQRKK